MKVSGSIFAPLLTHAANCRFSEMLMRQCSFALVAMLLVCLSGIMRMKVILATFLKMQSRISELATIIDTFFEAPYPQGPILTFQIFLFSGQQLHIPFFLGELLFL